MVILVIYNEDEHGLLEYEAISRRYLFDTHEDFQSHKLIGFCERILQFGYWSGAAS